MPLIARPYTPEDQAGFHHVRSMVYRGGEPVDSDESLFPPGSLGTVVELDGAIVGAATSLRIPMLLRGEPCLCGGVAAVGVLQHERRSGAGSELMRGLHSQLREAGFDFAALYAFREAWYRKFGYEVCGGRVRVTCPGHRLPHLGRTLAAYPLPAASFEAIEPVYNGFAARYSGMSQRDSDLWERVLGTDTSWTIYGIGDPLEAYAVVKLESGFWVPQTIREAVWATYEGYRGLLSLFQGLAINKTEISWHEPLDGPMLTAHLDQGIDLKLERQTMYRLLNVQQVLQRCRSDFDLSLKLGVIDPDIPENHGTWLINSSSAGAEVVQVQDEPDILISIQQLTQIVLGEPSATSLCNTGQIECPSPELYKSLNELFPPYRSYSLDFY